MDTPVENSLFNDRADAGKKLADKLKDHAAGQTVVLAIPSGGEMIGYEVSRGLHIPLDVVIAAKLRYPDVNGVVVAGVSEGDIVVFDNLILDQLNVLSDELDAKVYSKMQEIERCLGIFRNGRALPELNGYTVILVNDGIESGVTMLAAAEHVKSLNPDQVIIAVPVLSQEALNTLKDAVDDVVYLEMQGTLTITSQWYREFGPIDEATSKQILEQADSELKAYIESKNLEVTYSLPFHFGSLPLVPSSDGDDDPVEKNVI